MHPLRNHKAYVASIAHRLSGVGLASFLPFHFLLLGQAIEGQQGLDKVLAYTDNVLVKIAEWGLVMFLALHLLFGLRVLLLEFTRWPDRTEWLTSWVVPSIVTALLIGVIFLLQTL